MRQHLLPAAAVALIAALVVGLFYPTLRWLIDSWLGNPYYSHGFLIPPIAAYFAWRKRSAIRTGRPGNAGLVLLAAGIGVHLWVLPWQAHIVSALALIAVIAGLVWTFGGLRASRALLFPIALLATMIPVPWVERFSPPLEALAAQFSTSMARLVGVGAANVGGQIQLARGTFVVGAPCSGLRSIVALLTLTVILAYVVRGPTWARLLLVVMAIPIALAANLVRLSALFWVADTFGPEVGLGYYHYLSSPLLFVVAFAWLIVMAWSLRCSEIRDDI